MKSKTVREADARWVNLSTATYTRRTIGEFVVELIQAANGGGQINIWEKGESRLEHIWPPATIDGEDYHLADEVNFWDGENAQVEFNQLDDERAITNLMRRNA